MEPDDIGVSDETTVDSSDLETGSTDSGIVETSENVQTDSQEPTEDRANDPVAEFERLLAEESGVPQTPPPEELKLPEGVDPNSRSANRWQGLVNRTRVAETRTAELESQVNQASQYVQQVQNNAQQQIAQANAKAAELQGQLQVLQSQMQAFMSGKLVPKATSEDPAARLQERWMSEAEKLFNERMQAATNPLQEKIQKLEEASKLADRQRASEQYQTEALQAAREVALRELPPELAGELEGHLSGQILATAMFMDQPNMQKAAQIVRNNYLKFGLGILKARSQAHSKAQAKGKGVPSPVAKRRAPGRGDGMPTEEEIEKSGVDALTYMLRRDGRL